VLRDRAIGLSLHAAAGLLAAALAPGPVGQAAALAIPVVAFSPWLRPLPGLLALPAALGAWGLYSAAPDHAALLALVGLMVHQRLGPLSDRRDEWVVLISALLIVAGTVRVDHPAFLGAWLGWTATLPAALSSGWRARTSAALVVASLLAFLLLPRPSPPGVSRGLSDTVELGRFIPADPDDEVLARLQTDAPADRLRAGAFARFDGRRWTRDGAVGPWSPGVGATRPFTLTQGALDGVVLAPGLITRLDDPTITLRVDADGTLFGPQTALSGAWDPDAPLPPRVVEDPALLEVPDGLRAALLPTAAQLPADPDQRAQAIATWVHDEHRYDATGVARPGLEDFLTGSRRGDCAHFASAVVLLARTAGTPARLVTGLAGGERDSEGLTFRARDAHAWAELHLDGVGWIAVDATRAEAAPPEPRPTSPERAPTEPPPTEASPPPAPPMWVQAYERLLAFDAQDQRGLAGPLVALMAIGLAASGLRALLRRVGPSPARLPPRDGVAGELDRALDALRRRGWDLPPHLPPLELARAVAAEHGALAKPLEELAWLHYEVTFGGADPEARLDRARALALAVHALPGPPRGS
jgi:transglutaminase-like putative cysteine protease